MDLAAVWVALQVLETTTGSALCGASPAREGQERMRPALLPWAAEAASLSIAFPLWRWKLRGKIALIAAFCTNMICLITLYVVYNKQIFFSSPLAKYKPPFL